MPRPTETAWYPEEAIEVEVLSRGPYVTLIAWNNLGLYHEIYVENDDLVFNEDDIDEV